MPQYPFCVEIKLQTSDNVQSFISQQRLSGCVSFWSPLCRFRRRLLFCFRALGTRKVFYDAGKSDFEIKEGTPQRCLMGSGVFLYRVTRTKPQHPLIRRGRIVRIRTFLYHCWHFSHWRTKKKDCETSRQKCVQPSVRETFERFSLVEALNADCLCWRRRSRIQCFAMTMLFSVSVFISCVDYQRKVQNCSRSYRPNLAPRVHNTQLRLILITKMSLQANQSRDPTDLPR